MRPPSEDLGADGPEEEEDQGSQPMFALFSFCLGWLVFFGLCRLEGLVDEVGCSNADKLLCLLRSLSAVAMDAAYGRRYISPARRDRSDSGCGCGCGYSAKPVMGRCR